ncbi:MAG: DUF2782 domain-containing protein [Betaproteobacteria bacterium]
MNLSHILSRLAPLALVFAASVALAQTGLPPAPAPPPLPPAAPKLEPLPEIPPPPEISADTDLEPQVTISRSETEVREEARVAGAIVWIRVTPRHGKPYFLIPDGGANTYIRRDSLDSGLKVPMWVIFTF